MQEHFSTSGLVVFVALVRGLNVVIGLKEENQIGHDLEPRIRSLAASQVI